MPQIIIMLMTPWLSTCTVLLYVVLTTCVPFPDGIWGRLWDSFVSVPDHYFLIYFGCINTYDMIAFGFHLDCDISF